MTTEPTPPAFDDRINRASRSLDAQAFAFRYGVIPALVISGAVILFVTRDRPAGLVILTLGPAIVAALIASALLGGIAAILHALARQIDATARLDRRIAEAIERVAVTTEPARPVRTHVPDPAELRARQRAEVRQAIRSEQWDAAGPLVETFADTHPDDPEAVRLAGELVEARSAAGRDRLVKIEAAREANDPDRVIELRDEVKPLIDAEALRALDRDLAKWLMMLIHRRLRTGSVGVDVAVLAGRVAAGFDDTPEGASLRASLPTLRRAAGLCARCAQPYKGIADACPACLAGGSVHAPLAPAPPPQHPAPDPNGSS